MDRFVNLHSHTAGSHLDAIIRVPDLFKRVAELGQTAISITDHGNMSSMYLAYEEYKKYKAAGTPIKLIPGNEIYFCEDLTDKKAKRRHLVLLAANEVGYKNLLRITAAGFDNSVNVMGREFPRVDASTLIKYNEGLFATSACGGSIIAAHIFGGDRGAALTAAKVFQDIFGDRFFIELQPHNLTRGEFSQTYLNDQIKSIAEELGISMVATCDSHYLTAAHEKYHDMVLAISAKKALDDPTRHRYANIEPCIVCKGTGVFPPDTTTVCHGCMGTKIGKIKPCAEFYLKTGDQVRNFFVKSYGAKFADKLIDTCAKIADGCENPDYMEPKVFRLPTFPWQDEPDANEFMAWRKKKNVGDIKDDAAYLRFKIVKAFNVYCGKLDKEEQRKYWNRLQVEFETLEKQSFCSYMLIVGDFLNWARTNNIAIGTGRGSCGGSLIAFLLNIHLADPLKYGLLFERFHNKEKKSPPDIDFDVSPTHRDRIIDYCRTKYGAGKIAHISNVLKLTPKLVIKDVSRSLCIGGDKTTAFQIANEVTADIPDTIQDANGKVIKIDTMEKAIKVSRKLKQFIHDYPEVLDYANNLVGLPKTNALHAAGVIISDIPLNEYVPLRRDHDNIISVQYDKDACEALKLVKMDFLGLETLDVLSETWELAKKVGIDLPKPDLIPDGDELAFKIIQNGLTNGVFQLADTMTSLCKALKPNSIEDIALITAMGRPGCTKEDRQELIARRFGKSKITYPHPLLEPILKHTYGIKVYEEDLLKIGQSIAGWDLAEADGLRKLTKMKEKGADFAAKLEAKFVNDSKKTGQVTAEEAKYIWDNVIIDFAKYGFNKSHAILYSMLSYRTAYYKAHATAPFLCALLNAETRGNARDKAEKVDSLKKEAKKFKIGINHCDINISKQYYTLKDRRTIVSGLGAIKGLGAKALDAVIGHQPYVSLPDFLRRTPSTIVNKSIISALAKAGAMDSLSISRKFMHEHSPNIRKELLEYARKHEEDVIFGGFLYKQDALKAEEWDKKTILMFEKEVLGEFVSGSAREIYPDFFKGGIYAQPISKILSLANDTNFPLEGIITAIREIVIKKPGKNQGKTMGKLTVENMAGEAVDITLWADTYSKYSKYLNVGIPIRGLFRVNEFGGIKSLAEVNVEAVYVERKK